MTNTLSFKSISINNWRQFRSIDLDVHPRLTVITGANGAGKSTILNIFTQHFGFHRPYLSTPKPNRTGGFFYDVGLRQAKIADDKDDEQDLDVLPLPSGRLIEFGKITYSNGVESSVGVHEQGAQSYGLHISNQQAVPGVHMASHRALTNYQPIHNISLQPMRAAQAYNLFNQELMTRHGGGQSSFSSIYRLKEALIGMAAFGEGNSYLQPDKEVLDTFEGFVSVLKTVLPEEIGFEAIVIRIPDVVLKTKSGEFLLDSSSGGVNAIIEIAWQIYLFSKNQEIQGQNSFVVTMDEPENHLHPSMQRAIVPNLLTAFPKAQFIIATHSPFVVSAVEDSAVHVLNYSGRPPSSAPDVDEPSNERRVVSIKLDNMHKGGSAGEILREVLGVPVTTPKWVQTKVNELLRNYVGRPISNELLNELRADLSRNGFGELYPEALSRLVQASE